jgi:hypothetical protein
MQNSLTDQKIEEYGLESLSGRNPEGKNGYDVISVNSDDVFNSLCVSCKKISSHFKEKLLTEQGVCCKNCKNSESTLNQVSVSLALRGNPKNKFKNKLQNIIQGSSLKFNLTDYTN